MIEMLLMVVVIGVLIVILIAHMAQMAYMKGILHHFDKKFMDCYEVRLKGNDPVVQSDVPVDEFLVNFLREK